MNLRKKRSHMKTKIEKPQTPRADKLQNRVMLIANAVKQSNARLKHKCEIYPFWNIDVEQSERRANYPHLIVITDISPDGKTHAKLLKIELDSRWPSKKVLQKMLRMSGLGVLLCSSNHRIEQLRKMYPAVVKETKVVSDGLYFALFHEFWRSGLFDTIFKAADGRKVNFMPVGNGTDGLTFPSVTT